MTVTSPDVNTSVLSVMQPRPNEIYIDSDTIFLVATVLVTGLYLMYRFLLPPCCRRARTREYSLEEGASSREMAPMELPRAPPFGMDQEDSISSPVPRHPKEDLRTVALPPLLSPSDISTRPD